MNRRGFLTTLGLAVPAAVCGERVFSLLKTTQPLVARTIPVFLADDFYPVDVHGIIKNILTQDVVKAVEADFTHRAMSMMNQQIDAWSYA